MADLYSKNFQPPSTSRLQTHNQGVCSSASEYSYDDFSEGSSARTSSLGSFDYDAGNDLLQQSNEEISPTHTDSDTNPPQRKRRTKTFRACRACQVAHLTCDDGRPCKACVRRGLNGSCISGTHKKAKYLQDVPDEILKVGLRRSSKNSGQESKMDAVSNRAEFDEYDSGRRGSSGSSFSLPTAEPFLWLKRYMQNNFSPPESQKILRQITLFESHLSGLHSSDPADSAFNEVCFQRAVKEYQRLIGMSGTPTAVVRRNGEVCVVENEFCQLTGWSEEELMQGGRYLFEMITPRSTMDFFDSLLESVSGNSDSRISNCTLIAANRSQINCKWILTIKDDIFNCPSVVIAQFLPIS